MAVNSDLAENRQLAVYGPVLILKTAIFLWIKFYYQINLDNQYNQSYQNKMKS
jgi:hypothetical protein